MKVSTCSSPPQLPFGSLGSSSLPIMQRSFSSVLNWYSFSSCWFYDSPAIEVHSHISLSSSFSLYFGELSQDFKPWYSNSLIFLMKNGIHPPSLLLELQRSQFGRNLGRSWLAADPSAHWDPCQSCTPNCIIHGTRQQSWDTEFT